MTTPRLLAVALALSLVACGGDNAVAPTAPSPAPSLPDLTGSWGVTWTVQFVRQSDGLNGEYHCYGSLTLSQNRTTGSAATLSGFAIVNPDPCPLGTFDVSGSVRPNGEVDLRTVGPRPPEGQCPFVDSAAYSGVVDESGRLRARAEQVVDCPGEGEGTHTFNYILSARR